MTNNTAPKLTLSLGRRLVLFLCITVLCFIIAGVINGFLIHIKGSSPAMLRISAVIQDVVAFIIPALVTAVLVTRLPARFLAIDTPPRTKIWLTACAVLIVSLPAMNALIAWNESISLPGPWADLEQIMRNAEEAAQSSVNQLLSGNSVGALIVNVLIVGVLAGFSEELFFRGTFQRLLSTEGMNNHLAIWLVAFIFSASHLQFYGFFGRLLLGAYFGYLLYWSRCLWVPVIVHVFNNTVYVVGNYFASDSTEAVVNTVGTESVTMVCVSLLLTAGGLLLLRKSASDEQISR